MRHELHAENWFSWMFFGDELLQANLILRLFAVHFWALTCFPMGLSGDPLRPASLHASHFLSAV